MAENQDSKVGAVLVAGAGISGMQAALDLAEGGFYVYLLDNAPAIGGLMSRLDKTFPTNDCAMCVMSPKLVDCGRHLNIEVITHSEILGITGRPGNYSVAIRRKARSVDADKCTGCGDCVAECPSRFRVAPPDEQARLYEPDLSDEDARFAEALLADEPDPAGNLLALLRKIAGRYRHLPQRILQRLADTSGIPLARIVSVATFYGSFGLEPVGEWTISVCTGTACHVKGSGRLLKRLGEILNVAVGATTADGTFTLQAVRCLGCCALAPAVRIGDRTFADVRVGELEKILSEFQAPS